MIALPTTPVSLRRIFSNSIKTYLKTFVYMLPISVICSTCSVLIYISKYLHDYSVSYLGTSNVYLYLWIFLCNSLVLISICCGIRFIYNWPVDGRLHYKSALLIALKKFFPLIFGFILLEGIIIMLLIIPMRITASFESGFFKWIHSWVVLFFVVISATGQGVCFLEILTKKAKIFPAMKKALIVIFSIKAIMRVFFLFLLPMFALTIWDYPDLISHALFSSPLPHHLFVVLKFLGQIITFPFMVILYVYFYNDLIVRSGH